MRYLIPLALALSFAMPQASPAASADDAAQKAIQSGRFQEANDIYRLLITKNPGRADLHVSYGRFLESMGQTGMAMNEFNRAAQLKPSTDAYVELAQISLQVLDVQNSIKYSEAALKMDPKLRAARMVYVSSLMQAGRTPEADSQLAALLASDKDPEVYHLAYQIKMRKGDLLQARQYLQQAVDARPDRTDWMLDLCKLLESSGDYTTSRKYLQDALERKPTDIDARLRLARNLEVYENDYDGAINEYDRALQMDPQSGIALAGIDRCLAKKNDLALRLKQGLQSMFARH